jgi:hypothetical protein
VYNGLLRTALIYCKCISGVNITTAVCMVKVTADLHMKKNFTNFNPRLSRDIVKVNVPCYLRFVVFMVVSVKMTIFWDYGNILSAKNWPVIKRRGRRM